MITSCIVTTEDLEVAIVIEDAALVAQLPIHFPLRFRPLRGSHIETTLLGTQTGYSPAYTIVDTTLRIGRSDLVETFKKAGATWRGQIQLRDGAMILTQVE